MMLAGRDVNQYKLLNNLSLIDFNTLFSNFTDEIKRQQRIAQEHKKRAKRGR